MKINETSTISIVLVVGVVGSALATGSWVGKKDEKDIQQDYRLDLHRDGLKELTGEMKKLNETMLRIEKLEKEK